MQPKGKSLYVTLTFPVMPTGLTQDGVAVFQPAITNKTALDAFNVMALDYDAAILDMGLSAINAAQTLYCQLGAA